jgi:hypothetical protein
MNITLWLLWILSIITTIPYIHALPDEGWEIVEPTDRSTDTNQDDCDDYQTKLTIGTICAKRLKVLKAYLKDLRTNQIKADLICTDTITINHGLNVNDICSQTVSTSDLCVSGLARIEQVCGNYRAWAQYSVDTTYTLGSLLNFDNIVDNPDGDLTAQPTVFTTPVPGYYMLTLSIHQLGITPNSGIILGAPTAILSVYINDVLQTKSYFPYLTFFNEQDSTMSTLLRLQSGDKVTATYNVFTIDQVVGAMNVAGTAVIKGGSGASLFAIHYLSSDCDASSCTPCVPSTALPCATACEHS